MKYRIVYDSPERMRVRCGQYAFDDTQEQSLTEKLLDNPFIDTAVVSHLNGSILVTYRADKKADVLKLIKSIKKSDLEHRELSEMKQIDADFKKQLFKIIKRRILMKLFVPPGIGTVLTVYRALKYIKYGLEGLWDGKLNVAVLDAASITAAICNGSYGTASSVMTLLDISSLLESYTKKRAKNALADSLSMNIDNVWLVDGENLKKIPFMNVKVGDVIRVQSGSMIPIDGSVVSGEAEVNEASMTGESDLVVKSEGTTVYAGTVLEEGTIDICASQNPDNSRINRIIDMIDTSESLKAGIQSGAEKLADSIAPISFAVCALTYLFTRNVMKALSVLMVDYSCAIKLSTPISIISAMREAANHKIMIKGGKYLENFAKADTIVFDKTGTLTSSCPKVAKVVSLCDYSEDEVLKIAACLEEHFPHSVAKAIVHEAEVRDLKHQEEHAEVEYIVAHGISSTLHGKKALIGSAHFVFDDEKIKLTKKNEGIIKELAEKYSLIYLALGNKLSGVICIEDPVRDDAKDVIASLKAEGFKDILMLTGDGKTTAQNVCEYLGISDFYAQILPEDKAEIIQKIKQSGHKVVMVGDGINDSPALAAADVSVAMKDASDIAREVADITLLSSELNQLILIRDLSEKLFARIYKNYWFIVMFNTALLMLGIGGFIAPSTSAVMHNLSTMGICANSMRPLLKGKN